MKQLDLTEKRRAEGEATANGINRILFNMAKEFAVETGDSIQGANYATSIAVSALAGLILNLRRAGAPIDIGRVLAGVRQAIEQVEVIAPPDGRERLQ